MTTIKFRNKTGPWFRSQDRRFISQLKRGRKIALSLDHPSNFLAFSNFRLKHCEMYPSLQMSILINALIGLS